MGSWTYVTSLLCGERSITPRDIRMKIPTTMMRSAFGKNSSGRIVMTKTKEERKD